MKRLLWLLPGLVLPLCASADPLPQPLSLADAIAMALRTSPRMEAARAGVDAARAQLRSAKAQGKPSLDLDVTGQFQGPEVRIDPSAFAPKGGGSGGSTGGKKPSLPGGGVFQPAEQLQPELQATVPLYTGGRVSAGKRSATHAERAALLRQEEAGQSLVLDVTNAYLDTLEARRQADLAAVLRGLNQERLEVARVKVSAGTGIPLEVSQAEADLAASVQTEIDSRARVGQSGATLNVLIGRTATAPLNLASLPTVEPALPAPTPESMPLTPERLRAMGLDRPDLRALREDVQRSHAEVDAARASRRPLVNLRSNALARIPETLLGGFAWSLGASLVQSLFDGGRSRAQVEAARAGEGSARANLREAERQSEAQVERTRLALEAAEQRLAAEETRVRAAREALEVAQTRLHAGTVAPIEVTEAQTTLTRAETDALTARFEAARARVVLAYAAGVANPAGVSPAGSAPQPHDRKGKP